jgi:hypothetical protein
LINLQLKENKKCCNDKFVNFFYKCSITKKSGKISFCCKEELKKEFSRIKKILSKKKMNKDEIFFSSYKRIRGAAAHIIFKAFLGHNEHKYIRENFSDKQNSLLR